MKSIEDFFDKTILTPLKERIKEEKNLIQFIKVGELCEPELVDGTRDKLWGRYANEHVYYKKLYGKFYRVCRNYTLEDVFNKIEVDNMYFLDGRRIPYGTAADAALRRLEKNPVDLTIDLVEEGKKNFIGACNRITQIAEKTGKKQLVFIDNIDLIKDWGNLLKGIYDECLNKSINVMFIVSSPKSSGEESLAGRFEVIGGTNV